VQVTERVSGVTARSSRRGARRLIVMETSFFLYVRFKLWKRVVFFAFLACFLLLLLLLRVVSFSHPVVLKKNFRRLLSEKLAHSRKQTRRRRIVPRRKNRPLPEEVQNQSENRSRETTTETQKRSVISTNSRSAKEERKKFI